jgi:uncharacterized membrane protein (UPF0127 family)
VIVVHAADVSDFRADTPVARGFLPGCECALKINLYSGRLSQMRIWKIGCALFLTSLIGTGCGSSESPTKPASSSAVSSNAAATNKVQSAQNPEITGQAQPKLKTLKLWLGPEEMITEIAMSMHEITNGMMFRTEMAENEGMLFVFNGPHQSSFWMKNTLLPLSCAYIDPDGVILEIHDMKPKDETPITAATARVQYVLEVKQGWFERHKINVGTQARTERGTLAETFFGRR